MAKVGFWLKGSQGKLAGATLYKDANGETMAREVVKPKNPQTTQQMIQRILMNTIMQAYSLMKPICDHSFENVTAGSKSMGVFMKRNLDFAREKLSQMQANGVGFYDMNNFAPLGEKMFVPNQYLISTGSLPQILCAFSDNQGVAGKLIVPAITANTYQGVADAVGAQRGDQLTFLIIYNQSNVQRFRFCRVILDPTNADGSQAAMSTPFLEGTAINAASIRNEGTAGMQFAIVENVGLTVRAQEVGGVYSGGVIMSRLLNNSWLRSTCRLVYREAMSEEGLSMGACLAAAIENKAIYTPNDLYLNNAGQGNTAGVEAGSDAPSTGGGSTTPDTPSGGGTTPTTGIQTVSIAGTNLIAGTLGSANLDDNLVVRFNGAGDSVSVFAASDLEHSVASGNPVNGVVTIALTEAAGFARGTEYRIYVGGSYANYKFSIPANSDTPGED